MPTGNLFRFLLLLILMMRIVLATLCCRFGSWGLVIKLNFCSDFEHKVWSRFRSWSLVEILMFGWDFDKKCLIKILKLKFDQDLCKNLWYELNPRVRYAFDNVSLYVESICCCSSTLLVPARPLIIHKSISPILVVDGICTFLPNLKIPTCNLSNHI